MSLDALGHFARKHTLTLMMNEPFFGRVVELMDLHC